MACVYMMLLGLSASLAGETPIIAWKALISYRNARHTCGIDASLQLHISFDASSTDYIPEGSSQMMLLTWLCHWYSQNLSQNICHAEKARLQKRTTHWRAKNLSIASEESEIIRWMQLVGGYVQAKKHNHPFNREYFLQLTDCEIIESIGRNML